MSKAYVDSSRCKGCGLCAAYCKKEAITVIDETNPSGYKFVRVAEDKCIGCGICYTVCPDGAFTITEG